MPTEPSIGLMKDDTAREPAADPAAQPASVYPAEQGWVVAPPGDGEDIRFDGPNARDHALRYAYEAYGGARFFPF